MPGVRLNGFLASTAVALLLSAGGSALAQSAAPAAVTAPTGAKTAPAAASQAGELGETVSGAGESANPAPAAAAQATPTAAAPSPAKSATATDSAKPAGPPPTPAAAAAAEKPAAAAAAAANSAPPAQSKTSTPAAAAAAPASPAAVTAAAPAAPAAASAAAPAAAAPAIAAAPAAPTPTIDDRIADQLRQLSTGKFDRIIGDRSERTSIEAFYSGRSYAPLWITDGQANARAKAAIKYLAGVGADGLNPADYPVPDFKSLKDPQALATAELKFTMSVLTYAHHAWLGRVAWSRVDPNIYYDRKAPDPASVLAKLAGATDVAAALNSYEPHTAGYLALKAKLAQIRAGDRAGLKSPIPHGRVLRIGQQDDRVPQLRKILDVPGDGSTVYDKALAQAVMKFQKSHQLKATGTLTAATIDALNGPQPTHVIDTILANMERWRWMPHDLGNNYVLINLPDFTASVYHDGKRIWKTKIVIGMPSKPTPIMTVMMKFITVNPIWHVPPSIINNEYLPAMAQDPTVMKRMGLVVERGPNGRVIGIYQPPGPNSAEGRIRFNFPNQFMVFQHDTPDKYMFGYARRAFSHGCMRTQDPAKYAEVLLSLVDPQGHYTVKRIESMYGPNEINIPFPKPIPVNVTYQTAFVDSAGKLEFRDDIYGRDRELLAILHNKQEMKVADIPVVNHFAVSHLEILDGPDNPPVYSDRTGGPLGGPLGFFARLFGGIGDQQAAAPPPRPVYHRRVTRTSRPAWRRTYDR
jgi:murein L,D-transpeptidase YcbB/YkuD